MKNRIILFLLTIIACFTQQASAQNLPICDASICYTADSCNATINTQTYTYATIHNIYKSATANVDLQMDVYSPCSLPFPITSTSNPNTCSTCRRPFILLIHGGGFRSACRSGMEEECREFAKRGYIAASIDYRLGWVNGDENLQGCNPGFCFTTACGTIDANNCRKIYADSNDFALYRALQDAHAAMRYIVHFASQLNIDTRYLYIGGHSAGSVAAVNLTYVNATELSAALPGPASVLGSLDTVGNPYTDVFKIAGLYNNWGAVLDTALITGNINRIPMIAFHGSDDPVVPYGRANFLSCKHYDSSYGSYMIYKRLTNLYPGLPVELFSCKGGHGIFEENDAEGLYRIQKAICFFRNAKQGSTTTSLVERQETDNNITVDSLRVWFPLNCGSGTFAKMAGTTDEDHASIGTDQDNSIVCSYTLSAEKQVDINVFDMTGRKLSAFKTKQLKGTYTYRTAPVMMPGVYIVSVNFNGERAAVQKISIGR